MHDILNTLKDLYHSLSPQDWQLILAAVLAAPVTQGLKRLLSIDKSHWKFVALSVVSLVASAVVYLLNAPTNNPSIVAAHAALVAFMAQPVYYIFIKGFYQGVLADSFGQAAQLQKTLKSSIIPAGGVPLEALGAVAAPQDLSKEVLTQPVDFN